MDFDISYEVEDEAQFWQELDDIVRPPSSTPDAVSSTVNNFISFVSQFGADYLSEDEDVERCCAALLESELFGANAELVRAAMISYRPELENIAKCYVNLYLLLIDGQDNARTFKLMKRADMVPMIAQMAREHQKAAPRLTRLALKVLYEMCRMQKLTEKDLAYFDEEYIWYLLRTVENAQDDTDPFSYRSVKLIVSLNEQFMVAGLSQSQSRTSRSLSNPPPLASKDQAAAAVPPPQNSIVKVLSSHGARFKAFGENLIRLLNRERDPALQLLILKQLFLLFTNTATYEYFYTNDLHVLVDVFIRELNDLSDDEEALRHTYLRVLHPLLTHTQLHHAPYYKGSEIVALLNSLNQECSHFGPVGTTTVRLLARCLTVPWLLPPRRRRLRLPRSGSSDRKKSSKSDPPNLGMSLDSVDSASQISLKSIDSVNSITRVRPPTTPRIKTKPRDKQSPSLVVHLPPVKEMTASQKKTLESSGVIPDTKLANDKHDDLLREMNKLELAA